MRVVTSDLREAIAAVTDVYCPHDVTILESNRGIDAVLEAYSASHQKIVKLRRSREDRRRFVREPVVVHDVCGWLGDSDTGKAFGALGQGKDLALVAQSIQSAHV